jgi:hypothetical protein
LVTFEITCRPISLVGAEFLGGADLLLLPCDVILDGANFARSSSLATRLVADFIEAQEALQKSPSARVRLVSVRGARLGPVVLSDIDLRSCDFDGALGLDTMRIEGSDVFAGPPTSWRWVRRPVIAEEWYWRAYGHRGGPKVRVVNGIFVSQRVREEEGWAKIPDECKPPTLLESPPGPIPRRRIVAIYRELRKGREDNRDQANAADFYYSEMEMLRQRDHSSVLGGEKTRSWVDRLLLRLFWAVSGYDVRPARSATALLLVVVVGAVALRRWGYTHDTSLGAALVASVAATTAFFAAIDTTHLNLVGQLVAVLLRLMGPILLALTALGIRSRARR